MIEVPLQKKSGEVVGYAKIDDEDAPLVASLKWYIQRTNGDDQRYCYAAARVGRSVILMHRVIMGCERGMVVDHVNHDPLDNRRANLRKCSHAENIRNNQRSTMPASGLRNIAYNTRYWQRPWCVKVRRNYKATRAWFATRLEAIAWRDQALADLHGDFARNS